MWFQSSARPPPLTTQSSAQEGVINHVPASTSVPSAGFFYIRLNSSYSLCVVRTITVRPERDSNIAVPALLLAVANADVM